MDIETLQKDVEQLRKAYKWTVITCISILLLIVAILLLSRPDTDIYKNNIQVMQDSIKSLDGKYQKQQLQFQLYRTQDSMRTSTIHSDLLRTGDMIEAVKHRYDIQRTHLSTLPVDEQVSYFTNWVSQTDSL